MKRHSVNSAARLADDLESALDLWSLATVGTQERHGVDAPVPANRHALRPVLTRHNFPPHYKNIRRDIRKESRRFRLYTPHPCRGGVAALGPLGTLATVRRPGRGQKLLNSYARPLVACYGKNSVKIRKNPESLTGLRDLFCALLYAIILTSCSFSDK